MVSRPCHPSIGPLNLVRMHFSREGKGERLESQIVEAPVTIGLRDSTDLHAIPFPTLVIPKTQDVGYHQSHYLGWVLPPDTKE